MIGKQPRTAAAAPRLTRWLGSLLLLLTASAWANDDLVIYADARHNGWDDWGWITHYATNTPAQAGANSMCLVPTDNYQAWWLVHDPIDTSLYTSLTFWVHGGTNGGQNCAVNAMLNGSGSGLPRVALGPGGKLPTNAWLQVTLPLASLGVANKTNFNGLQFWCNTGGIGKPFCLDDIRLAAAPPPALVQVSVNATGAVRTVDPRIFGVNATAWDGNLDTASTRAVLNEMGNQVLRWPGGSWGDAYFMTNEYRGWGSYTTNFIRLATNTGAQVFFIVNYGSGTPAQAADWVRFCNVTNKVGFKYWEVGNENFGSWEEDWNTNAPYRPHDAWTYALRFKEYYQQMKAVDPTIRIGAVAEVGEDSWANYTDRTVTNSRTGQPHNGWTPVMLWNLRTNGVTPDFVVLHKYVPNNGDVQNLLWTRTWASDAANVRQMLTDYLGPAGAAVELVCTEHGAGGNKQRTSLVGGLFWADSLGQILRTEYNALLWWDLRNGRSTVTPDPTLYGWRTNTSGYYYDEGIIYDLAQPINRYPTFHCAKLVRNFARGGDTVVGAGSTYALLSPHAVRRTNGALTLLVVNKSSYAALNTSFNLAGFRPHTNATAWSYGIPQDEAARTGIGSMDITQATVALAGTNFTLAFPPFSATVLLLQPEPPRLAARAEPAGTVVEVLGQPAVPYVLQSSLAPAGPWTPVLTNTSPVGTFSYTNTQAAPAQFWRALWQP